MRRMAVSLAGCMIVMACRTTPAPLSNEQSDALATLLPQSIEIVEPFTRWADRDDRPGIDGLVVYVQPRNAAGDPVQAAGRLLIELYAFRDGSADHKGARLEHWSLPLLNSNDQDDHWNRATEMYEFRLALSGASAVDVPGQRFVLAATYRSVLGDNRNDECSLELPLARELLTRGPS
ncbi:MAG: hypothetical protein HOP29_18975 [Phycisphaerales bacterium]|nr:hypothetical protein [Phycisphaerales bacterium]